MCPVILRRGAAAAVVVLVAAAPALWSASHPYIKSHLGGYCRAVAVPEGGGSAVYAAMGPTVTGLSAVDQPTRAAFGMLGGEGYVNDIAIEGLTAYVAQSQGGLRVVGLGTAYSESGFSLAGGEKAEGLDATEDHVYMAVQDYGLRIFQTAIPTSPGLVGSAPKPGGTSYVWDVAVDEVSHCAFVAAGGTGVWAVDVTDPTEPVSGATWDTGNAYAVEVDNGWVYAAGFGGVAILPITGSCTLGASVFYPTAYDAREVSVAGGVAFVAARYLYAVDVSALPTLTDLGYCEIPGNAIGVATLDGTRAFVAAHEGGVQVVRRLSPSSGPSLVGGYNPLGQVQDVVVDGGYAYVAAGGQGLREVEAGTSGLALTGRSFDTGDFHASTVAVDSSHIYVGTYHVDSHDGDVQAVNRATFLADGRFYPPPWFAPVSDIETDGTYVYVAALNYDGFTVLTRANAVTPLEYVSDCSSWWDVYPTGPQDFSNSLKVEGSYAFVGTSLSGVQIVDIQNPAVPTRASSFEVVLSLPYVAPYGRYLYAQDSYVSSPRVLVLDMGDGPLPADPPTWMSTYWPSASPGYGYGARGLERQGATLISLWASWGLRTTGLGSPTDLQEGFVVDTPVAANCVSAAGSYAYVGLADGGLILVRVPEPVFSSNFESGAFDGWDDVVP